MRLGPKVTRVGFTQATSVFVVLLTGLVLAVAAGSLAVWTRIVSRLRNGEVLLPYEPRREVPWGAAHVAVLLLGGLFLLPILAGEAVGVSAGTDLSDLSITKRVRWTAAINLTNLLTTCGGAALLVVATGASRRDLGLPADGKTLLGDIRLGVLAFLGVALPVCAIKWLLVGWQLSLQQQPLEHPLVEMLRKTTDLRTVALAVFAAIGVAPVFEEFIVRLLVQGWLENVDVRWRQGRAPAADKAAVESGPDNDVLDGYPGGQPVQPDRCLPGAAPSGTGPIVLSSSLFALLHLGHGVDPIPLFFLAVAFGYLYHRTHRITPSIVMHVLFNGLALTVFWLNLAGQSAS